MAAGSHDIQEVAKRRKGRKTNYVKIAVVREPATHLWMIGCERLGKI